MESESAFGTLYQVNEAALVRNQQREAPNAGRAHAASREAHHSPLSRADHRASMTGDTACPGPFPPYV